LKRKGEDTRSSSSLDEEDAPCGSTSRPTSHEKIIKGRKCEKIAASSSSALNKRVNFKARPNKTLFGPKSLSVIARF
jgi:hypothetical protein